MVQILPRPKGGVELWGNGGRAFRWPTHVVGRVCDTFLEVGGRKPVAYPFAFSRVYDKFRCSALYYVNRDHPEQYI